MRDAHVHQLRRVNNTHALVLSLEGLVESGLACAASGRAAPNVVEMSCSQVVAFRLVAKTARLISLLRTHTEVALHSLVACSSTGDRTGQ